MLPDASFGTATDAVLTALPPALRSTVRHDRPSSIEIATFACVAPLHRSVAVAPGAQPSFG
jgi:hypothetical protein